VSSSGLGRRAGRLRRFRFLVLGSQDLPGRRDPVGSTQGLRSQTDDFSLGALASSPASFYRPAGGDASAPREKSVSFVRSAPGQTSR